MKDTEISKPEHDWWDDLTEKDKLTIKEGLEVPEEELVPMDEVFRKYLQND